MRYHMIDRHMSKIVEENIKHFPIVLLAGTRQIGKSTLLYHTFLDKGYPYVSLDDTLELSSAKSDPRTFLEIHKAPLIIDEAQKAPELFSELERIVNKSRLENRNEATHGVYILSGSQRQALLDEAKESLTGKVAILDMPNLSLSEIYERENVPFEVDVNKVSNRFKDYHINENQAFEYIVRGFFPTLYDDKNINTRVFYSSYLSTYLQKDLKELIAIENEVSFINFLRLLAANTGEEFVYDNYAKQVKVALNTIKSRISILVKTGVIYLVYPYHEYSIVKRIVKRPKMYFFDTGLAAYLSGIDSVEMLQNSFLKGRFFETFIFNEIRKTYINNGEMQELYYYRNFDHKEINLVLLRNGTLSLIEIKAGQSFTTSSVKAFKKLENTKYKKGKNAIICSVDKVSILSDDTILLPISTT